VKSHRDAGRQAIALIAWHDIHDCNEDIPAAQCFIREYYFEPEKGWKKPARSETVLGMTERFFAWVDEGCKSGA